MTVPTTGLYTGLYIYPAASVSSLGEEANTLVDAIDGTLGTPLLSNLAFFAQPIASGVDVLFNGNTISFIDDQGDPVVLSDGTGGNPALIAQGQGAFEFSSGGVDYIISNAPLTGAISFDDTLTDLSQTLSLLGGAEVILLKTLVDGAGLGGLLVLPSGDFGNGTYQPPCFVTGTLIETPDGERPVESLRAGELVTLATGIDAEIRWIGNRRVSGASDRPVRVCAGALAPGVPRRDLVVSPDHALFIDGLLVPAGLLANGETIRCEPDGGAVTYYHVELDAHGVLLAEGAPAESYLDTGNRRQFANCAMRYDPIDAARFDPCAEVLFAGPRLDAIRARLRVFA